jgi:MFS transporter, DHA2 family, multidrug resistance protein
VLTTPVAALRERSMLTGMWLTALPAAAFGVLDVLAPLRLDALGATSLALGATFFAAAAVEAVVSPTAGRAADRRGAIPIARVGLAIGAIALAVVNLPDSAWLLAVVVVFVAGLLGVLWVPAGLLLTAGADRIGLDTAYAFAFFNLGWAGGFTVGAAGGGALAQATGDVVPYLLLAGAYAATLAAATWTHGRWRRPEAPLRCRT